MTTLAAEPTTAPNSLERKSESPHQQQQQQQVPPQKLHHHQEEEDVISPVSSVAASPTQSVSRQRQQQQQEKETNVENVKPKLPPQQLIASTSALGELQSNLVMQDRIIGTLESDNQRLINENKNLRTKLRDAQQQIAQKSVSSSTGGVMVFPTTSSPQQDDQKKEVGGGVGGGGEKTAVSADTLLTVSALQTQIATMKQEMETERKDMVRKISWYIDRQEVGSAQDALISEQQQTIRDLRLQVADMEAQISTHGMTAKSEKDRTIKQLSRRNAELEEALKNRCPDSLTELIRASRPPLTESAEFKKMKTQLDEANSRLEEREQSAQRAISQLRIESDALRNQYAKRLERVEEEMKLRIQSTQTRKTKELEKQLNDTRRFYSEKVKDLEQQLAGYKRGDHHHHQNNNNRSSRGSHNNNNNNNNNDGESFSYNQNSNNNNNMNNNNNNNNNPFPRYAMPISSSSSSHPEPTPARNATSSRRAASSSGSSSSRNNNNNNSKENNNNQNNTNSNNMMMNNMQNQPYPMMMMMNPMMNQQQMMYPVVDPAMQQKIWFLETRVKSLEEENKFLQKTASESVLSTGAAAAVQSQLGEAQREVMTLQRLLRESQDQNKKTLQELDDRLHNERSEHGKEIERLTSHHRDEMKSLQTRCDAEIRLRSDSVTARQLMAFSSGLANIGGRELGEDCTSVSELRRYLLLLAERVHCLERQLAAAESEHLRQLSEVKRVAEFDLEVEKQKMGVALKQKNAEIDGFRIQLDSMLHQIAQLRKK